VADVTHVLEQAWGLAIAKQLVDLMGGDIWMESEFGKGSTFYFKVQLFKDQDKDLSESNSSSNTQTEKIPVSEIEDAKERANQASQQTSQPITQQASQKESPNFITHSNVFSGQQCTR
jgi:hypothetical protein